MEKTTAVWYSGESKQHGCTNGSTLGPVLTAGGGVQSHKSWWWERRERREVVRDEGGTRGDVEVAGTGGETAGGEGVREKKSW